MAKVEIRDHVISPQHRLDRVKLNIQRGPLGGFDRPDAERLQLLWNLADGLTVEQIKDKFAVKELTPRPRFDIFGQFDGYEG